MHNTNRHSVRIRDAKTLNLIIANNKSSIQIRRMRNNGSTIDIMDHHYQHHHLAVGLFRLHNAHFFLERPTSLGLYSKPIFRIRDPFQITVFMERNKYTNTHITSTTTSTRKHINKYTRLMRYKVAFPKIKLSYIVYSSVKIFLNIIKNRDV